MLDNIIKISIRNKLIVLLIMLFVTFFGIYALTQLNIGAVPDVTNNQVQVITTSRNLSTQDMEQYVTFPVEYEMANLPGVKEIRSVSKFGLSVVTIVFDDDMGTHLPRQLISEKLKSAADQIPEGFGTPFMGPITTGLGEIYQYILDVRPEYRDQYTITELRTIQDWIVKRGLSGIPGVVEVNTWGGYLKQYEVAINTTKLQANEISVREVFDALESNNHVVGGGYIEKNDQAYFIRGDGVVKDINDIGDIVVKNRNGVPIYIKDIAHVGYGSAPRFGAITANGEGEKVLGQVMMLKGANTNEVINRVKERVEQISASLPEGVFINGFLERSELIGKTMFTVSENLILGCLIVIFVVVLLLGNIRSGLVVASVIPLSLFFALGMMYIFDVDANLMSLGAIDFGIIIDGAVIIVEYIAYQLSTKRDQLIGLTGAELQRSKDKIAFQGAGKMMNSAIFGQLIILIVFIPILSMQGVEGKMFQPMAMVFGFALIGAMLMCLTYVPVMTSLVLKPEKQNTQNLAHRLIAAINYIYSPVIQAAMRIKGIVVLIAILLLSWAIMIFGTMGSEFVPTLDEGDFVIQPVLKTGTSLEKTIEYTTQIETILKENFPEVKQIVTRIGAAEVPTDPMSMEESDVIITLHPKSQWTSAKTKDELADKFKTALQVIPNMEVEFTQPIEMRFNELITGVRADIAIKIFGEDLSILSKKAAEIKDLIANVEGAADITVEKIEGLPQMSVQYDRAKIARYGLHIKEVNEVVSMAFAGRAVGYVFEGEKRFELVMRMEEAKRQSIDDLKNIMIDLPNGGKVPLHELALISYQKAAAKIVRDDTRRRTVVGVNVRNRDLQSVVEDIQALIDVNIDLPPNYLISYGGQFENLRSASNRLLIAVPVALLLIFILLYFAFRSIGEAILIFSAIPFAAIGGITLLWVRDMPFSISAGVGFIALFGIAVLNGIVLLEHYKELMPNTTQGYEEIIIQGAKDRLRAVMLTALAAVFGFLPMALSTGAGAEVQRPLATVVVGGLISSTMLTLVVLPVLYALYYRYFRFKKNGVVVASMVIILVLFLPGQNYGQLSKPADLEDLISIATTEHPHIKAQNLLIERANILASSRPQLPKTQFYFNRDENNIAINDRPLNVLGFAQSFSLPSVYRAHRAVKTAEIDIHNYQRQEDLRVLQLNITKLYHDYQYQSAKLSIYERIDSLHAQLPEWAARREALGEGSELDYYKALTLRKRIRLKRDLALLDRDNIVSQLKAFVPTMDSITIAHEPAQKFTIDPVFPLDHDDGYSNLPVLQKLQAENKLIQAENEYIHQQKLPDFTIEWFNGFNADLVRTGFQVGVNVALFTAQYNAQQKANQIYQSYLSQQVKATTWKIDSKRQELMNVLERHDRQLDFYKNEGLLLAQKMIDQAGRLLRQGEISVFEYTDKLRAAYQIQLEYLEVLHQYNQNAIELHYLISVN